MKNYKEHRDSILVDMTLLGDERAFEELVKRHEKNVKGTAYKTTGNTFSAEDAAQDAFVSAWLNLDSLSDRDKFGSWVCSIAKNHARNLVRKYKNAAADISLSLLEEVDLTGSDESGLYELLSSASIGEAERDLRLHEALDALSEKIRETINLHYFEGLSIAEIAQRLSLPAGTVKWRLCEGRRQLRKEYGIMEKDYTEHEDIVARVMRKVKEFRFLTHQNDRSWFPKYYETILNIVTDLSDSAEKSHALADVLMQGYWWHHGQKSKEILAEIKENAIKGRNEQVLSMVLFVENTRINGIVNQIKDMEENLIPFCREKKFRYVEAYLIFWLGRLKLMRDKEASEESLEHFREVLHLLPPSEPYYALSSAVIDLINRHGYNPEMNIQATGEEYRYVDGKLYFWIQPGFGREIAGLESALFFYASQCDSMILDESIHLGDSITSSDGRYTLSCVSETETVSTPAGLFENCRVFRLEGPIRITETAFCEGVGIVSQKLTKDGYSHEWKLSEYKAEGSGILPFAAGNEWKYTCTGNGDFTAVVESIYRVTSFDGTSAVVAHNYCRSELLYNRASFRGNILEAVHSLYIAKNHRTIPSIKSADALRRAYACAETKTDRIFAEIAQKVALNICENSHTNPDFKEQSIRDCFEAEVVAVRDGKTYFTRIPNKQHEYEFSSYLPFELTKESYPVMYNTIYSILNETAGVLWSDKWVDGYYEKGKIEWGRFQGHDYRIEVNVEDCQTNLGTFKNCRKVFVNASKFPQGYYYRGGHKTYWFAPGIGIVKMTALHHKKTCTSIWELTEYRGEGSENEYFPLGDGFFRRYEAVNMHPDYSASVEYTYSDNGGEINIFRCATGRMKREAYETAKANDVE